MSNEIRVSIVWNRNHPNHRCWTATWITPDGDDDRIDIDERIDEEADVHTIASGLLRWLEIPGVTYVCRISEPHQATFEFVVSERVIRSSRFLAKSKP